MRIAVLGGSKGCARQMVAQGLAKAPSDQQHTFTLLVRNPDTVDYDETQRSQAKFIQGDALDPEAVRKVVTGADIVVTSIGASLSPTLKMTHPSLCENGIKVLIGVLESLPEADRPHRLVAVTTTDGDEAPWLLRPLYRWILTVPLLDKKAMEGHITASCPIDWIIVRPSVLTNGALTRHYRTDFKQLTGYTISRQDVGHFLLEECLDDDKAKKWTKNYAVITY